jgi:photosystem II stability/assembly factor-like uncharacterized protein
MLTVFHTTDGGSTWSAATLAQPVYGQVYMSFAGNVGWIGLGLGGRPAIGVGGSYLYRTADGGATFVPVFAGAYGGSGFAPVGQTVWLDSTRGFGVNERGEPMLYSTNDGGSTWSPVRLPDSGPGWTAVSIGLPVVRAGQLLVPVAFENSQHQTGLAIMTSGNGGIAFQASTLLTDKSLPGVRQPFDLPMDTIDGNHWILDNGKVGYATSDAGQHWTTLPSAGKILNILAFSAPEIGFASYTSATCPSVTKPGGRAAAPCTI